MMRNSIFKTIALGSFALLASGAVAESPVSQCIISTPKGGKTTDQITEVQCSYSFKARIKKDFGDDGKVEVATLPADAKVSFDGVDKSEAYFEGGKVTLEKIADPEPPTGAVLTPSSELQSASSLQSPYKYTNKVQKVSSAQITARRAALSKDGSLSKDDKATLAKMKENHELSTVGPRLDALEVKIAAMADSGKYTPAQIERLKATLIDAQQLEHVQARDKKLDRKEAERLNRSVMFLEAQAAVISGDGLTEMTALVHEVISNARAAKRLTAAESAEVTKQMEAFNTKRAEYAKSDASISDSEREELLTMLRETQIYVRDKRDAKVNVGDYASNTTREILAARNDGLLGKKQAESMIAQINKVVKDSKDNKEDKEQIFAKIRAIRGNELDFEDANLKRKEAMKNNKDKQDDDNASSERAYRARKAADHEMPVVHTVHTKKHK
ncbi:MAG: hypothetical protein ABIR96_00035 [Bdellovibrionota bacterium]